MPEALLQARGLSKRYGGVQAVTDISLDVFAGEVLCLVGPNGAGKTTLVDLITGVQSADSGTLTLGGTPVTGPPAQRAHIGLGRTFQHPQLAHTLTVRENILLGATAAALATTPKMVRNLVRSVVANVSAGDEERVAAVSADLGLGDTSRLCGDLTLGEQRLVEVARALVQRPTVLLLDEPFAGSDELGAAAVMAAIRHVADRRHGVVLVDHNVDIVAAVATRIVLMDLGRVVFDGDPQACLNSIEMQQVYFGGVAHAG